MDFLIILQQQNQISRSRMTYTTDAIILRAFMFSDNKMMVDSLSREEGRTSYVLKTGKSRSTKNRQQIFQPLSILELTTEKKNNTNNLSTIKEAHVCTPFTSIPFDPYKLAISMFLAEFLCNVTWSERDSEVLYDYISESILWLDNASSGFSNFHLVFMMRLTRFVGFYPNMEDFHNGCSFDMLNGCFTETPVAYESAKRKDMLGPDDTQKMYTLMRMNYGNMHLFKMSRSERNRCLDVIIDFYRLHIPDFRDMKSLPILRELFC